jgi:hypothetical protein
LVWVDPEDDWDSGRWAAPEAVPGIAVIDEDLLTVDDHLAEAEWPYLPSPGDSYAEMAERYSVDRLPDVDERPQWEMDLETHGLDEPSDDLGLVGAAEVNDDSNNCQGTEPVEASAFACENPNGCGGPLVAARRCKPCHEYRRTHHGDERPKRLINRSKRRRSPA